METIKVRIYIPQEVALARSQTHYGEAFVEPTQEQLAALTDEQRAKLESQLRSTWLLHTNGQTWADVLAALELQLGEDRAEAARREKEILLALSLPLSAWVDDAGELRTWIGGLRVDMDPRLVARCAEAEPLAFARRNEIAARKVEEEARLFREHNERAARAEKYAHLCRAYVREHVPEFARAAADGCDVNRHAESHATRAIIDRIEHSDLRVIDTYLSNAPAHACPSQYAYSVFDVVTKALTEQELPTPIASATPRIVRDDTCEDCRAIRTCVEIEFAWKDGTTGRITVYADTEEPHVHGE